MGADIKGMGSDVFGGVKVLLRWTFGPEMLL